MNKVKQTQIGMKNHNIEAYLEMSLECYLSGKKIPNNAYEVTNYLGKKKGGCIYIQLICAPRVRANSTGLGNKRMDTLKLMPSSNQPNIRS